MPPKAAWSSLTKPTIQTKSANPLLHVGIIAVIPSRVNRIVQHPLDVVAYETRHLVENYFARIKQFRRIATRYEKTDTSFAGMIDLVATVIAIMR